MTTTEQRPTAAARRPVSPSGSRRRCGRSSAATCRCGCAPGTAPRPGPPMRRWWAALARRRCAGCCGTRASSGPPRPTSPASSRSHGDLDDALTHVWSVGRRARRSPASTLAAALRPRAAYCARRRRGRARRPRRPSRRPGSAAGCTAAAGPGGDQPPLRPVQRVLLADPRPARWPTPRATGRPTTRRTRVEDAQRDKLDLVCRKLGLEPGHALPRRRLRLGFAVPARRRSTSARRSPA